MSTAVNQNTTGVTPHKPSLIAGNTSSLTTYSSSTTEANLNPSNLFFISSFNSDNDNELHQLVKNNKSKELKAALNSLYKTNNHARFVNARNKEGFTPFTLALELKSTCALVFFSPDQNNYEIKFEEEFHSAKSEFIIQVVRNSVLDNGKINEFLTDIIIPRLLKQKNINVNHTNLDGLTPLMIAIMRRNHRVVDLLLNDKRVLINDATYKTSNNGSDIESSLFSPAFVAIYYKNYLALEKLIKCPRFDINAKTPGIHFTPLSFAIRKRDETAAKMLLKCENIDINSPTISNVTPLFISAFKGMNNITNLLLQNPNIQPNLLENEKEMGPLHIAISKYISDNKNAAGRLEVIKTILKSSKINIFLHGASKSKLSSLMIAKFTKDLSEAKDLKNPLIELIKDYFKDRFVIDIHSDNFRLFKKHLKNETTFEINKDKAPSLYFPKPKNDVEFLNSNFINIMRSINSIQISKGGYLYSDDSNQKIALGQIVEKKLILTFCDIENFEEFAFQKPVCPFTRSPLTNIIADENTKNKVFVLDKFKLAYIAKSAELDCLDQSLQAIMNKRTLIRIKA